MYETVHKSKEAAQRECYLHIYDCKFTLTKVNCSKRNLVLRKMSSMERYRLGYQCRYTYSLLVN